MTCIYKQIKDINESMKMTSTCNISTKRKYSSQQNFSNYSGSHKKARFDNRQKSFLEKARPPFKKGKARGRAENSKNS